MDLITAYRDFVLGIIVLPTKIPVLKRMKNHHDSEEEYGFYSTKLGIGPAIEVDVSIYDVYSRSAKVIVKFDRYEKDFIYYIGRHFSPAAQIAKFDEKIRDLVNNTLKEDERWELLEELEKKERALIFGKFKKKPIIE